MQTSQQQQRFNQAVVSECLCSLSRANTLTHATGFHMLTLPLYDAVTNQPIPIISIVPGYHLREMMTHRSFIGWVILPPISVMAIPNPAMKL